MTRTLSVCTEPGCPELASSGKCESHRQQARRESDSRRPNAQARGYGPRWRATRRIYLMAHPICQDREGCISEATEVHHLDGKGPNGELGHDPENLQALCHTHHAKITAIEQPGGWAA